MCAHCATLLSGWSRNKSGGKSYEAIFGIIRTAKKSTFLISKVLLAFVTIGGKILFELYDSIIEKYWIFFIFMKHPFITATGITLAQLCTLRKTTTCMFVRYQAFY